MGEFFKGLSGAKFNKVIGFFPLTLSLRIVLKCVLCMKNLQPCLFEKTLDHSLL